tara:strand:- start:714 stop:1679 length:966 start_codon:yes stop_codon:yes gene_type:complete
MEVINSFFSNIKDKLTNPYFGTLILVLLIHHWELFFSIFNFDDGLTLSEKLILIETYIENNITWKSFIWDALQAMIYMFTGYLIIILTRSIVLFIEHWVMPFVTGKVVHKNVVRRTEYNEVVKEREDYFDQYEEQRKQVRDFSKTIDEQTEQIKQKNENLIDQSTKISDTTAEIQLLNSKLEIANKEFKSSKATNDQLQNANRNLELDKKKYIAKLEGYERFFYSEQNVGFYNHSDKFPPEVLNKVIELYEESSWDLFLKVAGFYRRGGTIGDDLIKKMITKGLVFDDNDINMRGLTPLGELIYAYQDVLWGAHFTESGHK